MTRNFQYAIAVAAIFALTAIGICALQVAILAHGAADTNDHLDQMTGEARQAVQHLDAAITDLDRTVQIAGGTLNQARVIERDNRLDIMRANQQTLATLKHVDALVLSFDVTQQQAGKSIADTSAALVPVITQAHDDLAALKPAIDQVEPLLMRTTDVAVNVSNATADVEHEIHKLVYPPPRKWYQKWLLDPLKTAAHLITIPLGHV